MKYLKEIRMQQGYSQQDVANYLEITRQAYSNYETGNRTPDNETLLKLGEFFDVSLDVLLRGKEKAPSYAGEQEQKKPAVNNGGLDESLVNLLVDLSPAQIQRVKDFVAGIKAVPEGQTSGSESGQQ